MSASGGPRENQRLNLSGRDPDSLTLPPTAGEPAGEPLPHLLLSAWSGQGGGVVGQWAIGPHSPGVLFRRG